MAASECLLGIAGPSYTQTTLDADPVRRNRRAVSHVAAGPLTDALCSAAGKGWLLNKGSAWFDGNYLNTLYNHYLTPNSRRSPIARSTTIQAGRPPGAFHPGGVNVLFTDGHVTFVKDTVASGTPGQFDLDSGRRTKFTAWGNSETY